jgi:cytochrome c5
MILAIRVAAVVLVIAIYTCARPVVVVGADLQVGPTAAAPAQSGAAAGKEILGRKCFQCHQATMWTSLRQDRKAWEGTLYRMVGRGALWTEEEINAMADFLAETRGSGK